MNVNAAPTTDLSQLIANLDTPKQSFPDPGFIGNDNPEPEPEETEKPTKTDTEKPVKQDPEKDYNKIAKKWWRLIDIPTTQVASWIASESARSLSIDEDDALYMVEILADMAEDGDWKDPGGWPSLLMTAIFVYGGMMKNAIAIGKEKKAAKAKENKELVFTRSCPECGKPINYKNKDLYLKESANIIPCKQCQEQTK